MLAPHELKNKDFSKSLRGYSTVEVDEHIAFLIEKYTELYRENDQLEKKLRLTEAQLDSLKAEEESIRSTLMNAQKASARIIAEANERADIIMRSAKNSYDGLVSELKASVKAENEKLISIQKEIGAFKAALFAAYQTHIQDIEQIAPEVEIEKFDEAKAEEISALVLGRIKKDLAGKAPIISGTDDGFTELDDYEENEINEDEVVRTSSEVDLPDQIVFDEDDDEEQITEIRDSSEQYTDDDEDEMSEEEIEPADESEDEAVDDDEEVKIDEDYDDEDEDEVEVEVDRKPLSSSLGIIDSIKKLNEDASAGGNTDDDEEFLRMLGKVSEKSDDSLSSTNEFDRVYNGK